MNEPFRLYEPHELGADGYPPEWHALSDDWLIGWASSIGESHYPPGARMGLKHVVRAEAGHRCARCGHPFVCGETPGEWSPCDRQCNHRGPARLSYTADDGSYVDRHPHELGTEAGVVVGYGKRVEARWRVLTVHHLDGNKANCRWFNLAALCQRCHLTIQGRVRMERTWPWEHTPWFRVYVAGYYALTYLGEELSRVETVARLDELLDLERVA